MAILTSVASLDGNPDAVAITPYSGPKFAYLISASANVYTSMTAVITLASAGLELSAYVLYDTAETVAGEDIAYVSVAPAAAPGNATTIYSVVASQVATGTDDSGVTHGGQTGWTRVTHVFAGAGTYIITFAVANIPDSFYNSALAVVRPREQWAQTRCHAAAFAPTQSCLAPSKRYPRTAAAVAPRLLAQSCRPTPVVPCTAQDHIQVTTRVSP